MNKIWRYQKKGVDLQRFGASLLLEEKYEKFTR
jgi:hypothetical protein